MYSTLADNQRTQVAVQGCPIRYDRAGSGPPLILLHGWGGSARYWAPSLAALADAHDLVAPDLPGFGETPPISGAVSPAHFADLVIAFADALGIERFDLNGHSFCAGVAAHLAARHPHHVRRLILTCFSTFRDERERRIVDQIHNVMALWMALRRPWMARWRPFYRAVSSRFFYRVPADDALLRQSFADFLLMDRHVAVESAASSGDPAITTALAAVRAPTLLIGARHDQIMPPTGTPIVASRIPDCRLVWIEDCGHLPMIEQPELYHRLVRGFLAE